MVEEKDLNVEDFFSGNKALHGELFWEYRAKTAEYEKALAEFRFAEYKSNLEKQDPKYKKLLSLLEAEGSCRDALKKQADYLRSVQKKVAQSLGVELLTFLNDCVIDEETGVVRFLDK